MKLSLYFFRQFIPPFIFGSVLFMFVLLLDRLFDIIDLIFNKGVEWRLVAHLFVLFIPTVLPLTLPMASFMACLVTFGRLSEENELSAVRAAGIPLTRVLWLPPFFAFLISAAMVPFNTEVAPWANRGFRNIYEQIANADPLINIQPKKFFSVKNIKLFPEFVDKKSQRLENMFVFQTNENGAPPERIFARSGTLRAEPDSYHLDLTDGHVDRYGALSSKEFTHTSFKTYRISLPISRDMASNATRFRNFSSKELGQMIQDMKSKGMTTLALQAEQSLRLAIAFAPFSLAMVGIPLATVLKRGGKGFGFGVSIVVIFAYYILLITGLTLAEKGFLPSHLALGMGNGLCLLGSIVLIRRLMKQ